MTDMVVAERYFPDSTEVNPDLLPLQFGARGDPRLFSRILEPLAATHGYAAGLERLGERLRAEEPARFLRFYYEEILGRSPETAQLALLPVDSPADTIRALLSSDEFMYNHDIVFQRGFPNLTREFFLHVPKSGGTSIFQAFASDKRFCPLHLFPGFDNGWFADRLGYGTSE